MTRKKEKTNNNSTNSNGARQNASHVIDDYFCFYGLVKKPLTEASIDALCDRMIQFGLNQMGFSVIAFINKEGMDEKEYYRLIAKYPKLKQCHEKMKQLIGEKREVFLYNKESNSMRYTQRYYHSEFAQAYEEEKDREKEILKYKDDLGSASKQNENRLAFEQQRIKDKDHRDFMMRMEEKKHDHDKELLNLRTEAQLKINKDESSPKIIPFLNVCYSCKEECGGHKKHDK